MCQCIEEHALLCDCKHHHSDHVFGGGCNLCDCEQYSQKKQVVGNAELWKQRQRGIMLAQREIERARSRYARA